MSRTRVLSLYRRILKARRFWEGPEKEREYIRSEARAQFKANMNLTDRGEIEQKMFEGESRLEMAIHYGIPYPRLHHKVSKHHYLQVPETNSLTKR